MIIQVQVHHFPLCIFSLFQQHVPLNLFESFSFPDQTKVEYFNDEDECCANDEKTRTDSILV